VPSDSFSHTTTVAAAPNDIYAALQDPVTWKGVGPIDEVWDASHDDDRLASFRWSARAAGRSWEGTAERLTETHEPSMALVLDSPEVSGRLTIDLTENGGGTDLTATLTARSKGLLAGMFWGVISDALGSGFPRQVEEFGNRF
jgi:hypothetical protein